MGYGAGVSKGKSEAERARARAMERLLAGERERLESLASGAVAVGVAYARMAAAQAALEVAAVGFRAEVAAMVELGKSSEEIAALAEVPVTAVRSARRPPKAAGGRAVEPVAGRVPPPAPGGRDDDYTPAGVDDTGAAA